MRPGRAALYDVATVGVGKPDVDDQDVRRFRLEALEQFGAGSNSGGLEPFLLQAAQQDASQVEIVFDDHYLDAGHGCSVALPSALRPRPFRGHSRMVCNGAVSMKRLPALVLLALLLAACGSKHAQPAPATTTAVPAPTTTTTTAAATTTTSTATTTAAPGALQAEVAATAAGDIPDNQVFVAYPGKTFTMKFPEGWTQTGSGDNVTFRDKNNIVRVVIGPGAAPTVASVKHELAGLKGAKTTRAPRPVKIGGTTAVKATYETTSAPNAVTGKSVTLTVDRYELAKGGKRAIVDLGTPAGVDNVDAYRLMIESLRIK